MPGIPHASCARNEQSMSRWRILSNLGECGYVWIIGDDCMIKKKCWSVVFENEFYTMQIYSFGYDGWEIIFFLWKYNVLNLEI